jgi:CelD/BcsL family acetyltransferase involved in cellulose biosynthesis
MKTTVLRPSELGPAELARWQQLQRGSPSLANPFLSQSFTVAVGRVRAGARVAVLEERQEVVGFFPYERGVLPIGRPIGAGVSDCQALIHTAGLDWDAQGLLRGCGLDVWEFDHLLADQAPFTPYHLVREPSFIMDVVDGYEAYLEDRRHTSRRTVTSLLKKRSKLEAEAGAIRFDFDCMDVEVLRRLMHWKSAQYRRTGWSDRFAKSWIVRLVEDLFETRTPECSGTLSALYAGGRLVAAHFGLRSQSVLSCWFPTYDVSFYKYSPGLLLHLEMAKAAAAQGLSYLDLGKGEAEYKNVLGNRHLQVAEGWVERPSTVAVVRRVQRAPRRQALNFVLRRPRLRRGARRALRQVARLRGAR